MSTVVRQLILKDWRLYRPLIFLTLEWGALALGALWLFRKETVFVVGSVLFFIALITVGCLLPGVSILNERKKQHLPFVMSLPISSIEYTTAKLVATVGMFLVPWTALGIAAMWLIGGAGIFPHGVIPVALILMMMPLVGFSMNLGVTLVGETEGWNIAANMVFNSSYGLIWYFMTTSPAIMADMKSPVAVWNSARLTFLGGELALVVLSVGITYYLQSKKQDFV